MRIERLLLMIKHRKTKAMETRGESRASILKEANAMANLQENRRSKIKRLSKKGRRADALALGADERRDKLRKAAGSCT